MDRKKRSGRDLAVQVAEQTAAHLAKISRRPLEADARGEKQVMDSVDLFTCVSHILFHSCFMYTDASRSRLAQICYRCDPHSHS